MKRNNTICLYSIVFFILFMSGCVVYNPNEVYVPQALQAVPLEEPLQQVAEMTQIARAANEFSFALSATFAQEIENENFIISPYSAWLPLAALLNATDDAYKEPLAELLGGAGVGVEDINHAASRMMFDLSRANEGSSPLTIANTIFVRSSETIRRDFVETFHGYYRGTAMSVNFQDPETVGIVNQWIYDNTNGLISDLVQDFDPMHVLSVINAIHFYDRWEYEFHSSLTSQDVFYSPSGITCAYFMRSEGLPRFYFEDDTIQSTRLGFSQGGGMYILLPKSGDAVSFLENMTLEYFT